MIKSFSWLESELRKEGTDNCQLPLSSSSDSSVRESETYFYYETMSSIISRAGHRAQHNRLCERISLLTAVLIMTTSL